VEMIVREFDFEVKCGLFFKIVEKAGKIINRYVSC
jgi:hypothetical protein